MRKNRLIKPCNTCGKPVERPPSKFTESNLVFCDNFCRSIWLRSLCGPASHSWAGGKCVPTKCEECGVDFNVLPSQINKRFCSRTCRDLHMRGFLAPRWFGSGYKHPDFKRVWAANQRAIKCGRVGNLTVWEWERVLAEHDHKCAACGKSRSETILVIDHIVPITRGGHTKYSNIQPLCQQCNSKKGTKIIFFKYGFEVTDMSIVPRAFLGICEPMIELTVAQQQAQTTIPGIEVYPLD